MIHLAGAAFGLLLGAIFGSFIATLCLRWPEGRSVLSGRSHCDGCGNPIPARHLVPLLSASVSGGRARCCGGRIDPFHGRVEWAAALLGAAAMGAFPNVQGLALAALGWLLLPLFLLDLRHFWLPDPLVLTLAAGGMALGGTLNGIDYGERAVTALAGGLSLALLGLAYRLVRHREGLGGGDPKLLAALALWLGAVGTLASLLLAALIGLAEALLRRRSVTEAQPLGTYLCIAGFLVGCWQIWSA